MGNAILSQCHTGTSDLQAQKQLSTIIHLSKQSFKQQSMLATAHSLSQQYKLLSFPQRSLKIQSTYQFLLQKSNHLELFSLEPVEYSIQRQQMLCYFGVKSIKELLEKQVNNRLYSQKKSHENQPQLHLQLIQYSLKPQSTVQVSLNTSLERQDYRQRSLSKSFTSDMNQIIGQIGIQHQDFPSLYNLQRLNIFGKDYTYIGFVNQRNKPHGPGQLYYSCQDSVTRVENKKENSEDIFVEAQFIDGQIATSDAVIIFGEGSYYRGGYVGHLFSGKGQMKLQNGIKLIGRFIEGRLQGKGKAIYHDGGYYQGHFHLGLRQGKGTMTWKSQQLNKDSLIPLEIIYQGYFKADKMEGLGNLKTPNYEYWGPFVQNMKEGKGSIKFDDGRKFEGWFQKDEICGYGELHYADGKVEKGVFPLNKQE